MRRRGWGRWEGLFPRSQGVHPAFSKRWLSPCAWCRDLRAQGLLFRGAFQQGGGAPALLSR